MEVDRLREMTTCGDAKLRSEIALTDSLSVFNATKERGFVIMYGAYSLRAS